MIGPSRAVLVGSTSYTLGQTFRFRQAFISNYPTGSMVQNDGRQFKIHIMIDQPGIGTLREVNKMIEVQSMDLTIV